MRNILKSNSSSLVIMVLTTNALLVFANYCGVGFTYDSYLYVKIARQVGENGLLLAEGFTVKPPLYPLLIHWLGVEAIFVINLVCLSVTTCILYFLGYAIKTKTLRILFWTVSVLATPLYSVHSFAWTEPLFISILLFAFYLIHAYQKSNKSIYMYTSMVLLLLLPFVRFAGVFIMVPTLLVLLLKLPARSRWKFAIITGIGMLILCAWVWQFEVGFIRRWNTLIAPIVGASFSRYTSNIDSYLEALSIWILPLPIYRSIRILLASAVLITIGVTSINFFRRQGDVFQSGISFIFLCYYLTLHFVFSVEYYSAERYLTPMYNLLILSLFLWLDQKLMFMRHSIRRATWVLLLTLLTYNLVRTTKNVLFWHQIRCTMMYQCGCIICQSDKYTILYLIPTHNSMRNAIYDR